MIDANHPLCSRGSHGNPITIFDTGCQWLFDEDVAALFERLNRQGRVRGRWREDMDNIDTGIKELLGRSKCLAMSRLGDGLDPRGIQITDPDNLNIRQPLQRLEMELADIAGPDEADPVFSLVNHW